VLEALNILDKKFKEFLNQLTEKESEEVKAAELNKT